jgi:hypothetical protein
MSTQTDNQQDSTKTEELKKLTVFEYLDKQRLTRAQRSFYQKQYKEFENQQNSLKEWNKIVKFVH